LSYALAVLRADLHARGALSDDQLEAAKARLLGLGLLTLQRGEPIEIRESDGTALTPFARSRQ
jgi:hypothetical protein